MDKKRYLVIIVRPPSEVASVPPGRRPSLLVPFSPEAVIRAFIDELWKRLARHGGAIPLTPETHNVSLHLEHEDGPAIDIEDLLSDVILDAQREKIFAVFSEKMSAANGMQGAQVTSRLVPTTPNDQEEDSLSFRIITPSTTRSRDSCPILKIPVSATIHQLHIRVTSAIGCTSAPQETVEACECNCTLAKDVALGPSNPTHFLVIHGKSIVEKLPLEVATVDCLQQALFSRFGQDLATRKKITYHGATQDSDDSSLYKKTPVVSLCSKHRHIPVHARVNLDGSDRIRPQVVDLHTSELPIHPACFESSIAALGLSSLAVDDIVDIFAVLRTSSAELPLLKGKSAIFRDLAHWEPSTAQSDRGMALFLSSLRVFTSILQDVQSEESVRDAAYYVFEELTRFPPALRCLHLLVGGQTPTVFECAALSQSVFQVLKAYMHLEMDAITRDPARLFEGSRLIFGFILRSAKSLHETPDGGRANEEEAASGLRYTSAFQTYDLRDHKTQEPVLHTLQTSNGLIEASLLHALQEGGVLAETHLQSFLIQTETDPRLTRFALQSGGTSPEVLVLSSSELKNSYGPNRVGINHALDFDKLSSLLQLAEMCGRNGLAVHGPSQLTSAVAPCLAFDCNAHLAVYTGEQPCGEPGKSSIIVRPQHGEETTDPSVMEQLIAPIIKTYEQDGSAVFDAFGGAEVRRLQEPDEIIMFCVDSSASMHGETDFSEVNEEDTGPRKHSRSPVEGELHSALSVEESKDSLVAYESFGDMIAIIATAPERHKAQMTEKVMAVLTSMLSSEINKKAKDLEDERWSTFLPVWRTRMSNLESDLTKLKAFCAGLKRHKKDLVQFLRFRASRLSSNATQKWWWSFDDPVPAVPGSLTIPMLADDLTEVPKHLRCPISHELMEDAVEATDGEIYSDKAIRQWFAIRETSPLYGAPLELSLNVRRDIRREVDAWIAAPAASTSSNVTTVTFSSRVGSFTRTIARTTSLRELYRLAYRGLKAKFQAFQLSVRGIGTLSASMDTDVSSIGLMNLEHITIQIPEDADTIEGASQNAFVMSQDETPEMCLVKVFESTEEQLFGFWVPRDTTKTLKSVIWKYWRYKLRTGRNLEVGNPHVYTNVRQIGDGWYDSLPTDETARLADYLIPGRCTGQLQSETVFNANMSTPASHPSHKVLKIFIKQDDEDERNYRLTRLDVLKQMFEALINRMLAYNYKNHVGLVKFSSHAEVVMSISHVLENFRRATIELEGGGDTALWDALALAGDQIEQYACMFPDAKKRIVVISDGMDTKSMANSSHSITSELLRKGIAVDSVLLGNEDNTDLRTLSYLLGSYRFHPVSLTNALAICEMEPFLSLSQRPQVTPPLQSLAHSARPETQFQASRVRATETVVTAVTVPPIMQHPNVTDDFVQLIAFASRRNVASTGVSSPSINGPGRLSLRVPRLMSEIRTIAARGAHAKYDIYISTADVSFWKIVMEGPDGSPYSGGTFLLYLHADEGYPRLAPKARFLTKIKHPNVNTHGRICHSIFDRDWTSDTSMGAVLDTIFGLLYQPESSDPVNTTATLGFFHDPVEFAEEAEEYVWNYASKTREEWKVEVLGQ